MKSTREVAENIGNWWYYYKDKEYFSNEPLVDKIESALQDEREACAKIVQFGLDDKGEPFNGRIDCANAVRKRGE